MPVVRQSSAPATTAQKKPAPENKRQESTGLLSGLETDDIILLVVFLILIMDNCDDKLLLLALGYIFFSGRTGN